MTAVDVGILTLLVALVGLVVQTNVRLSRLDQRLTEVEGRLSERITKVEADITAMRGQMEAGFAEVRKEMAQEVGGLGERLTALEAKS